MTTRIVNLKRDPYDVYIGRAGQGEDGYFGNPIRRGLCTRCKRYHGEGRETLPCFTGYFYDRLQSDPEFKRRVLELEGKTLGCFCKPMACHGDVIVYYLEYRPSEIVRVSGDALCGICYQPYYNHPLAKEPENLSGIDGHPYLHRCCNGGLLKL